MKRLTHVLIGFAAGLYVSFDLYSLLYGISGSLGAYVPDIRHPPYRRGRLSHSLVMPILLFIFTYSIYMSLPVETRYFLPVIVVRNAFYAFLLGWATHVLTDSLSAGGVYILWPFSDKRVRLTKLRSNSLVLNILGLFIAFTMIYFWLIISGLNDVIEELVDKIIGFSSSLSYQLRTIV